MSTPKKTANSAKTVNGNGKTLRYYVNTLQKRGFTIREMEEKAKVGKNVIATAAAREDQGFKATDRLIKKVANAFEFELTGKRTFVGDRDEIIEAMANQIESMRGYIEVLLTEVAQIQSPSNVSKRKLELTKTCQGEAERRIGKLQS